MALIVKVYINERCIIDTHTVRVHGKPGQLCTYEVPGGKRIVHHYDDGPEDLAITLLKLVKENRVASEYHPQAQQKEVTQVKKRSCNRHDDCDKADIEGRTLHCSAEDCEDCFGQ